METISQPPQPQESAGIAYSYIRFSSMEQAKGDSKGRQTAASEEYAQEHGLTIDWSLHLQDLGISAFREKMPQKEPSPASSKPSRLAK